MSDTITSSTNEADEYMTTEELAARWHTTPTGIINQRYRGNAPRGYRLGRRILFRRSDVIAFEAERADAKPGAA